MDPRPPSASQSVLTRWLGIPDSNTAGFVHGGVIMRFCDEVAGIAAVRHSGCRVVHVSTAYLTMVALGDEGRPTEVPPLEPGTPDEHRRAREAQLRRDNRLAERGRIEAERAGED